jgi:hypothetical protein
MSDYLDSNRGAVPPLAGTSIHSPQTLEDTGTTESSSTSRFTKDRMYVLSVGAVALRVLFGPTPGTGSNVPAAGGAIIPANSLFTFRSGVDALYVYVEAADATSAYKASVWLREA